MASALIGASGYVGSTLLKQSSFEQQYRSTNIAEISGRTFERVVCAGAPAQKWLANREPDADRQNIERLIAHLDTIRCDFFVLISTVDVFASPIGVTEASPISTAGESLHPYGRHRRLLETFVQERFARHLIVRLPGLVGPGLRKNAIFDLLNSNNLHAIDSRGRFQFYPMVNLGPDLERAQQLGLKLLHLVAEPVSVAEVASEGFGHPFAQTLQNAPAVYDVQSLHAAELGGTAPYQYSRRESMLAVRAYAQCEPAAARSAG